MSLSDSSSFSELSALNNDDLFKFFLNDDLGQSIDADVPNDSPYSLPPLSPDPLDLEMQYTSSPMDHPIPMLKEELSEVPRAHASVKKESRKGTSSSSASPSSSPSPSSFSSVVNSEEERQLKRQRRLVKNRESAQLSRMRKKVYMEDLESKLNALTTENSALKGEVAQLQHIIKQITANKQEGTNTNTNNNIFPSINNRVALARASPPSRNAHAGICLLIVLFSLGLLVNVSGHGSALRINYESLRMNEALPRTRRDSTAIGSLMDTSEKQGEKNQIDELWESDSDDMDPGEVHSDHGMKRMAPEEEEEEDCLPNNHKRTRTRAPGVDISEEAEHEEMGNENPVAIALLVPPHPRHHPPELSQVLSSFHGGNHRILNVHVWPLSR